MVYVPAPMPYWMRLTSYGIGMHGGLIPEPGKPASHGCIRMPKEFVPILFDSVVVGTPVTISHAKSKQGPMVESQPQPKMVGELRVNETRRLAQSENPGIPLNRPRRITDPFSAY